MAIQLMNSFVQPLVHQETDLWELAKEITSENYTAYQQALNSYMDTCDDDTLSPGQKARVGVMQRYLWSTTTNFCHETFEMVKEAAQGTAT